MNKKPDVLDTFSKVMFFSKWNSPNQTIENKKKREEDVAFIQSELERLAELDRISDLVKDTEPVKALEELKNGLFGHCKSSYLKDDPKELSEFKQCKEKKCPYSLPCHKTCHSLKSLTKAPQSFMYIEVE